MNEEQPNLGLSKSQSDLISYLFDARESASSTQLAAWIAAVPRYSAFVERYKVKIRKKLRGAREPGAASDLLIELQIPTWLLLENRFEVAYEPYLADKIRGPDFSVTYCTQSKFNIEVTHLHNPHLKKTAEADLIDAGIDLHLVDVICGKLRQMLANSPNLLFIVSAPAVVAALDLPAHLARIKDKAEHNDRVFYARQGYQGTADFFKAFERLSGIVLYDPEKNRPVHLWLNPQARVKLLEPVKGLIQKGITG